MLMDRLKKTDTTHMQASAPASQDRREPQPEPAADPTPEIVAPDPALANALHLTAVNAQAVLDALEQGDSVALGRRLDVLRLMLDHAIDTVVVARYELRRGER